MDILAVLKHIAEIKLLLFMLGTHLCPRDYTASISIKCAFTHSPLMLSSVWLILF